MVDGNEVHLRRYEDVVADGDAIAVYRGAVLLDEHVLFDFQVLPEVHVERWEQGEGWIGPGYVAKTSRTSSAVRTGCSSLQLDHRIGMMS